jgi:hypothetical protein
MTPQSTVVIRKLADGAILSVLRVGVVALLPRPNLDG